jgi:hypothetical protein
MLKLVADGDELGESNLPGIESHRAARCAEVHAQIGIGNVTECLAQRLVDLVDRNRLIFAVAATELMRQQLVELCLTVFRRVEIDDDVLFVAVPVWEFDAGWIGGLVVGAPDDVFTFVGVDALFDGLAEGRG